MTQPGYFQLYPSARPVLDAGDYVATARQDLTAQTHDGPQPMTVSTDVHFTIDAPRFKMPPDQILSTFPPAGSQGDWRERFPQIVLKRRTLPWERNPDLNPASDPHTAPPWLALVVLADGEGQLSADVDVTECVTPGVELGPGADVPRGRYLAVTKSIIDKVFPCRDELDLLCHVRRVDLRDTELALGDDDGYLAVVLSSRLPQPARSPDDPKVLLPLKYTAYLVNLEGQLPALLATEPAPSPFFDATLSQAFIEQQYLAPAPNATVDQIAMGIGAGAGVNQFVEAAPLAAIDRASTVESALAPFGAAKGLESAAASWATGPAKRGAVLAGDKDAAVKFKSGVDRGIVIVGIDPIHRFPVLASWEFTCTGEGGFERLMNGLHVGLLGTAVDLDETGQPVTPPPPDLEVAATGHIALAHRTRRGESTRSWYRGPLSPQPTTRLQPVDGVLALAHTGDQLRRLVPDGREDVSLAALFEIGRLLTLNKPMLVASLMGWRRSLFGAARARELADALAAGAVAGLGVSAAGGRTTIENLLRSSIVGTFTTIAPDALAPGAPPVTAARLPDELRELTSDLMLRGLGIDPGAVGQLGKQFGVDGLAGAPVAVAPASPEPATGDKIAMVRLNRVLGQRVDELVVSALKVSGVSPATGRPTRRRARDTLDRLIDDAAARTAEPTERKGH